MCIISLMSMRLVDITFDLEICMSRNRQESRYIQNHARKTPNYKQHDNIYIYQ